MEVMGWVNLALRESRKATGPPWELGGGPIAHRPLSPGGRDLLSWSQPVGLDPLRWGETRKPEVYPAPAAQGGGMGCLRLAGLPSSCASHHLLMRRSETTLAPYSPRPAWLKYDVARPPRLTQALRKAIKLHAVWDAAGGKWGCDSSLTLPPTS